MGWYKIKELQGVGVREEEKLDAKATYSRGQGTLKDGVEEMSKKKQ